VGQFDASGCPIVAEHSQPDGSLSITRKEGNLMAWCNGKEHRLGQSVHNVWHGKVISTIDDVKTAQLCFNREVAWSTNGSNVCFLCIASPFKEEEVVREYEAEFKGLDAA
jgi:hypothetical protein